MNFMTRFRSLILLTAAAAALRFHGLFANSFHPDEALFASLARHIAVWRRPLLVDLPVDKPPLLFYVQAAFYPLLGTDAAWVARLPNLTVSILLVPLTAHLVWRLYGDRMASLLAAIFVAFSPFAVQFSATAFTDPFLTFLLLAALVQATHEPHKPEKGGRGHAAGYRTGLLLGLAVATKYQAWLFLPLLAGIVGLRRWRRANWARLLGGLSVPLLVVLLWDLARSGTLSLWSRQIVGFGGLRLAWSWELWPRLSAWSELWGVLLGSPLLSFGLILAMPVFLALLIQRQDRDTAYDQLFLLFTLGYAAAHWFLAVPVWDRYLLPVLPIVAILLGRFAAHVVDFVTPATSRTRTWLRRALPVALFLLLLFPGVQARAGQFAVGGRPAADAGAAEIGNILAAAPQGTVLYDHWFSWQWRYYLFDTGVYVSWFAHPAALVEDLQVFDHRRAARYLALPNGPRARPVRRVLDDAGYYLATLYEAPGMTLYEIIPGDQLAWISAFRRR